MISFAERKALKASLLEAALNGISRWVMSDESGLANAGVTLHNYGTYIQIRMPQEVGGPEYFTIKVTESR